MNDPRLLRRTPVLVLLAACVVLSLGMGWWMHHARARLEETAFERSYVVGAAFARAVERWIEKDEVETIERVAQLMLTGDASFIEIRIDGDIVLSLTDDAPSTGKLVNDSPQSEDMPEVRLRRLGTWWHDVSLPMRERGTPIGEVRIILDASSHRAMATAATVRLGATAAAVGLALMMLLFVVRRRLEQGQGHQHGCRELVHVDRDVRKLVVRNEPVSLTPKQYELVELLLSRQGSVVTEEEILATVWPDSPYADSNDIRQCIYKIRRRLAAAWPGADACLVNEKGFGYRVSTSVLEELPAQVEQPTEPHDQMKGAHGE